jgi:hypothetical protein
LRLDARQDAQDKPVTTERTAPRPEAEEDHGRVLACARCLREVTTSADRIEVGGRHAHTFANPHGFSYHIGCFAQAGGCWAAGQPTTYWTWFPPYAWQIEHCASCGEHLGWLFRSDADRFHGLILDRLVELGGPGGDDERN